MDAFSLKNETALITGGGSGIGLAIAECFVEAGARVTIVGRREQLLQQAVEALGSQASYKVFDITETDKIDDLLNDIDPVSILVNNAGIHLKKLAEDTTVEELQRVLDTHVLASFALSRAVIPTMKHRQHGNILYIASMASIMGIPQVVAYSAAKTAMIGMVRTIAVEVGADGIRVNAIAPGWIETAMSRKAMAKDQQRTDRVLARTPMGKFGKSEDIGWAAVYLCSPAASFVTGTLLTVDGGISIGF